MNFLKIKNTGIVDVKDGFIKITDNKIDVMKVIVFKLMDSWGDGWNGNILIVDEDDTTNDGDEINITMEHHHQENVVISLDSTKVYKLYFNTDDGFYQSEVRFTIANSEDEFPVIELNDEGQFDENQFNNFENINQYTINNKGTLSFNGNNGKWELVKGNPNALPPESGGDTGWDTWEDNDGDGVPKALDAFPDDPDEQNDADYDGVGDNADAFPNDPTKQ